MCIVRSTSVASTTSLYVFLDLPRECCVTMFFVYNSFGPRSARRIHIAVRAESGIAYSCAWSIRTLKRICYFYECTFRVTIASMRLRGAVYNNAIATSQPWVAESRNESVHTYDLYMRRCFYLVEVCLSFIPTITANFLHREASNHIALRLYRRVCDCIQYLGHGIGKQGGWLALTVRLCSQMSSLADHFRFG